MTTFPFLTLPPTVFDKVLTNVELPDLFDFAQCSKKAFNLVKNCCRSFEWESLMLLTLGNTTKISLHRRVMLGPIEWHFYHKRNLIVPDLENPKPYQFPFNSIDFCHEPGAFLFESSTQLSTLELINFIKYIKELFNASLYGLYICDRLDCLDHLRSLFRTCISLRTGTFFVSHEEMRSILKFPVTGDYFIYCSTFPGFTCELPLCHNFIHITDAQWMTRQMLLNLRCYTAILKNCKLTEEDLNQYLHQWLHSKVSSLHYIVFHKKHPNGSLDSGIYDISKVVQGLPTVPGTRKRLQDSFYTRNNRERQGVHFENGLDFRRETDGMLASVVITKDQTNKNALLFVPWHVPNPNVP